MEADPIVLLAPADFNLSGRPVRAGDTVVIRPGHYVKLVQDLPLDLGPIMGAELRGHLQILTSNRQQLVALASVVGLERPFLSPAPSSRLLRRPARRRGAGLFVVR